MKILITGITGFVGSHLAEYCLSKSNTKVCGTFLRKEESDNIEPIRNKLTLFKCDLTKKNQVYKVISQVKPDKIFHLAGQSQVYFSFQSPEKTLFNNLAVFGFYLNNFK